MAIPSSLSYGELTSANVRFGLGTNVQLEASIDFLNGTTPNPSYIKWARDPKNKD